MPSRHPRDERAELRLIAFGGRVRELRLRLDRSQEEFAHDCGFHRTYVGSIERGEANPTILTAYRLADALGVPAVELFS